MKNPSDSSRPPHQGNSEPLDHTCAPVLFLVLLLLTTFVTALLIGEHRMPRAHDTLIDFFLQYFFLDNAARAGSAPQWIPFMAQGTSTAFWNVASGGLLLNVLMMLGRLLKNGNFLVWFHLGLYVEQLILLTGTWLLSRRIFRSVFSAFFVAASLAGSCVWMSQIWFNLHLYYALPLLLYLGHRFLDTGRWRYFFLAGNLFALQMIGNTVYVLPMIGLTIFLYFVFHLLFDAKQTAAFLRRLSFNRSCLAALAGVGLSFLTLWLYLFIGHTQLVFYSGRGANGGVPLHEYLNYGGHFHWGIWLEPLLGLSPSLDYTLYFGVIAAVLSVWGLLFNTSRKSMPFLLTAVLLFLITAAPPVAAFFYFTWPLMKFYRHLLLIIPLIKVFLCFLAGFGLDALLIPENTKMQRFLRAGLWGPAAILLALSAWLAWLAGHYPQALETLAGISTSGLPQIGNYEILSDFTRALFGMKSFLSVVYTPGLMAARLIRSLAVTVPAALLFSALFFTFNRRPFRWFLMALVVLQLADVYTYQLSEIRLRSISLSRKQEHLLDFRNIPYHARRPAFTGENASPRAAEFFRLLSPAALDNWIANAFLLEDQAASETRTDTWMLSWDYLLRAYAHQPLDDLSEPPAEAKKRSLFFPLDHPSAGKIAGITEDKIQFFRTAVLAPSDQRLANLLASPDYRGNALFLSPANDRMKKNTAAALFSGRPPSLSANDRLNISYKVTRFDADNLVVHATVPGRHAWLFYSDVWHPFWHASVNGRPAPVWQADLAYKAIPLSHGAQTIRLHFGSPLLRALSYVFGANALFWLIILAFLIFRILAPRGSPSALISRRTAVLLGCTLLFIAALFVFHREVRPATNADRLAPLQYLDDFSRGEKPFNKHLFESGLGLTDLLAHRLPYKALAMADMGFCSYYLGNLPQSLAFYKTAIELDPRFYTFYFDLGEILLRYRQFSAAATLLERSLLSLESTSNIYNLLHAKLLQSGSTSSAREMEILLDRARHDRQYLYRTLPRIYFALGQYDKMAAAAFAGASRFADNAGILTNAGVAALLTHNPAKASKFLSRARALDPGRKFLRDYQALAHDVRPVDRKKLIALFARNNPVNRETTLLHFYGLSTSTFMVYYGITGMR